MYIVENIVKRNGKHYRCVMLRESYREGGQVKNRTLANLTHCKPNEIAAMRLALDHKDDLCGLGAVLDEVQVQEGLSVGAVWTVHQIARRIGLEKALGTDRSGKLALWQVLARTINQGSRLSAVRLAQSHAALEVLGLSTGFDEEDLYDNLDWLQEHQQEIEKRLFRARWGSKKPGLFLYDVTSSYLEGEQNELGERGYNRDHKNGKKQIVIGLLCDELGVPVSVEVFKGNTSDLKTFASQVKKVARHFGCEQVTFVGDRGMIKGPQIAQLAGAGFHYITGLTKPQIQMLISKSVLQLELFDEKLCEIEHNKVRYLLRRNPERAEETAASRQDKKASIQALVTSKNTYLAEHERAQADKAQAEVERKLLRLKVNGWLQVELEGRTLKLREDEQALEELSQLDGCYVLRTDLSSEQATTQQVHERYKDLAKVEHLFRTSKTGHLEVRPVFVRKGDRTRGHVLVVMLSQLIVLELSSLWQNLELTVEEGLKCLSTLTCDQWHIAKLGTTLLRIPRPRQQSCELLEAAKIELPKTLPKRSADVVTKTKLLKQRA